MNTTPQRPQQQRRRVRHTTLSGENSSKLHAVQSSSALQRPQQRRTPQQPQRSSTKLQRQHSVSCCTPTTGKLTPPQFTRLQPSKTGSQTSLLFAGSKFMDSPAPDTIPMPPAHWFSTAVDLTPRRTSPTPSSVSDSLSSASSFEDAKSSAGSSDELLSGFVAEQRRGFRVNPMQLIATVAAVV